MRAADLISGINKNKITKPNVTLHDVADHLNTLTFVILTILSAGSIVSQMLSRPINCYTPQVPSGLNFEGTLQSYCWVTGTYNIPPKTSYNNEAQWKEAWKNHGISNEFIKIFYKFISFIIIGYYQWIPFILSGMCMMFYIPSIFWNYFCENVPDVDIKSVIAIAEGSKNSNMKNRQSKAEQLASLLYNFFIEHKEFDKGLYTNCRRILHKALGIFFLSKRMGSRILGNYFIVKIVYMIVIGLQLWILSSVFGLNHSTVIGIFTDTSNQIFPTRTTCHWNNVLGQGDSYNTSCLLSWNFVYKYIFGVLWFIFVSLLAVNIASTLTCIWNNISYNQQKTIKKYLVMVKLRENLKDSIMVDFRNKFMNNDGFFMLNMLKRIAGKSMVEEVLFCLWKRYEAQINFKNVETQ